MGTFKTTEDQRSEMFSRLEKIEGGAGFLRVLDPDQFTIGFDIDGLMENLGDMIQDAAKEISNIVDETEKHPVKEEVAP